MKLKFILINAIIPLCLVMTKGQTNGNYRTLEEAFNNPEQVVELQLSGIVKKLPNDIKKFTNLETIRLINLSNEYNLDDAFKKLGKYTSVKRIYLNGNAHKTLPSSLSRINTLEFIELNRNLSGNLKSIIDQLVELKNFKSLSLRAMRLERLPENIIKLNIVDLNLGNNPRLDLVKEFERLSNLQLETLDISSSNFTVVPENIYKLNSLIRLEIEMNNANFNNAQSYINIAQLKNLKELNIQGNFFGSLDPAIEKLNFLKVLEIDGNCIVDKSFENLIKLLPKTEIKNETPC